MLCYSEFCLLSPFPEKKKNLSSMCAVVLQEVNVYRISIFLAKCLLKCETNSKVHDTAEVGGVRHYPQPGQWLGGSSTQSLESND